MTLSRTQTILLLFLAALFFAFTLLQASWLADKPVGKPKLIADHGVEPVRDAAGCIASANAGYGTVSVGPDVGALQGAVGAGADAVRVTTEMAGGKLVLAPQFESKCPVDQSRRPVAIAEAQAALTKPELFWQVGSADAAQILADAIPANDRSIFFGNARSLQPLRKKRIEPALLDVGAAGRCVSDYRKSGWTGQIPRTCRDGWALLTLDDLGYSLWGWPNRFLERMAKANVRVIIAEDVVDGQIKGLTQVIQYGEIADSYNGYIWVDNIQELGPALKR
jgi:glycerophosphoryl diester phosphodiesterase